MAVINVNREVTDQFYRYKMPRLIAKVEGKGNGIKTVIANMTDVAKSLNRPPTYPTKYFGCELGAQTQFDLKNDRYIVNGSHESNKLQDLLDGFIRKFVLCTECDNPETTLTIHAKKGLISARCKACGHTFQIDPRHRLATFILKNPPDQEPGTTPSKKDKRGKKGKKDGEDEDRQSPETTTENGKEELPADREIDDDDWGEDTSEAAIQQRMMDLTSAAKSLALHEDLEKTQQERLDIFYSFIKRIKNTGDMCLAEKDKDILAEAERLDIRDKASLILVELLFDENIVDQIKKYRRIFLRFTHENQKAQKYLLGGFEQLVGNVHKDVLIPKVPHILKALYDEDIIEEEVLLDWDKKLSKKYVSKEVNMEIHQKAAPLIKWLQEAEEESEEDESEEEEDVEVVYSKTERVGTTVMPKPIADEEDDFDIDAI